MNRKFLDFITSPRRVLGAAALIGVVMLIVVQFFPVFYRDSVNYMAAVNAVWLKNWTTAFNLTFVPVLFLAASLFRPLGLDANQCLSLVSSLCALGMLFPAYKVLSFYMDRRLAAWGSVLFFITPPVFRTSFAPLTDSARWFFFFLCWMMILMYREKPNVFKLVLFGLFYALFALVRSEGIVFVGLFSVWFFLEQGRGADWKKGVRQLCKITGTVVLPLVVMGVLLLPRLIQIHRETGFCALDTRQTWAIKGALAHIFPEKAERKKADPLIDYSSDLKFHYSYVADGRWNRRYWDSLFSGNYRLYAVFTVIGLILVIRRREWRYFHTVFCIFLLANALAYMLMRSNAGRYFYINTFLLMPFTLKGFSGVWEGLSLLPEKFRERVVRLLPLAICVTLAGLAFSGMKNALTGDHKYYRTVGKMMREESRKIAPRSGTKHPVYLIIGENYGWGFHCGGSEIVSTVPLCRSTPGGMRGILLEGVPSRLCSFVVDPLENVPTLKPDYVLVCGGDGPEVLADCADLLEVIPQKLSSKVQICKVRRPAERL